MKAVITIEDSGADTITVKLDFVPPVSPSDIATPAVSEAIECLSFLHNRLGKDTRSATIKEAAE